MEQCGWNSAIVMVKQWRGDSGTVLVEQWGWHSNGGTVWWNNETVIVERCGGKWNSGTV